MNDEKLAQANTYATQIDRLKSTIRDLKIEGRAYSVSIDKFITPVVLPVLEKYLAELIQKYEEL